MQMHPDYLALLQRLEQEQRDRHPYGLFERGSPPYFLGLYAIEQAPAMVHARQVTQAPIVLSEECFPGMEAYMLVYTHDESDLSAFWAEVDKYRAERE